MVHFFCSFCSLFHELSDLIGREFTRGQKQETRIRVLKLPSTRPQRSSTNFSQPAKHGTRPSIELSKFVVALRRCKDRLRRV